MLTRRDSLRAGLAGLGLAITPAQLWASVHASPRAADPVLDRVCDLVIPQTSTPGALAVGVPAFVLLALDHSDGITPDASTWGRVSTSLAARGFGRGGDDAHILAAFDAAAFAPAPDLAGQAWHKIKSLIVTGYYTSEAGGSQELHYDLVPGRFDADLPVAQATPELSNDWIAVNFR